MKEEELIKWFSGVCLENDTQIEMVTSSKECTDVLKVIDEAYEEMKKDENKKHCIVYLNGIKTIMVEGDKK